MDYNPSPHQPDALPTPFVIFLVFVAVIIVIQIISTLANTKTRQGTDLLDEAERQPLLYSGDRELDRELARRHYEELLTEHGSQVRFTRHIYNGKVERMSLTINGAKYELCLDRSKRGYEYRVTHEPASEMKQEKEKARKAKVKVIGVDGAYVCLVGWTSLPEDKLQTICSLVKARFPSNQPLGGSEALQLLEELAGAIVDHQAADWDWLVEHFSLRHDKNRELPPPTPCMKYERRKKQDKGKAKERANRRRSHGDDYLFQQQSLFASQAATDAAQAACLPVDMGGTGPPS